MIYLYKKNIVLYKGKIEITLKYEILLFGLLPK